MRTKVKKEKDVEEKYKPQFPEIHKILKETYTYSMTASDKICGDEMILQANGVFEALKALKKDGVLPEMFNRTFHEDITDVMKVVHEDIKLERLTSNQGASTFAIATLQSIFGGK